MSDLELPIATISPSSENPRRMMDHASLEGLAASIRQHGVIQPLIVRPIGDGTAYEIIAGHRRYAAAQLAGLTTVPVRIMEDASDQAAHVMRVLENLQRANLNPIEEAAALDTMRGRFDMSVETIAAYLGKSTAWVYRTLQLLELPTMVQDALRTRRLAAMQGWALQRYRAFPKLVERLALIAMRDGVPAKALDVPFIQARELINAGLVVPLYTTVKGFDFDQCASCPFHAYFPTQDGGAYCANPTHYRILLHEARTAERDTPAPMAALPAKAGTRTSKRGAGPASLPEILRHMKALDRAIESLSPAQAANPELRARVDQLLSVLERVLGVQVVRGDDMQDEAVST